MRGLCGLLATALLLQASPVRADRNDTPDHERAREALRAGQVLPLRTLLDKLEQAQPGQVLEVELAHEEGRWVYEVKLLKSDGQLRKLKLDARTGRLLRSRATGTHDD